MYKDDLVIPVRCYRWSRHVEAELPVAAQMSSAFPLSSEITLVDTNSLVWNAPDSGKITCKQGSMRVSAWNRHTRWRG